MTTLPYEPVIGLEVHCQLQTQSKLFSSAPAGYSDDPNTNIDLVTLAHPGVLPVVNETAIEYIVKLGLATNCSIRSISHFARKHYFYPDLTKGYQISQFEDPICYNGHLEVKWEDNNGEEQIDHVRIARIHLEEDAGKSVHDRDATRTLLDYNRAGVPLAEIVTEPDLKSPRQAYEYMRMIRRLVRYLGICDGNMEEGSLRCDANISVRPANTKTLGVKTEIKNMNSFKHVEAALQFEIDRQVSELSAGREVVQETRLWDTTKLVTRTMRSKEEAHDYRYFKDPDLPPIVVSHDALSSIRSSIPALPKERIEQYTTGYGLTAYDAEVLAEEKDVSDYFESVLKELNKSARLNGETAKQSANIVMTDVLRVVKAEDTSVAEFPISPEQLAGLVLLRTDGTISSTAGQELFDRMMTSTESAQDIAETENLISVSDSAALKPVVVQVLTENPKQVTQYLGGKTTIVGYFVGQVMRSFPGFADPVEVRRLLEEELEARRE